MKFTRKSAGPSSRKPAAKFGKSKSRANVAGYEKRKAGKAGPTSHADLYEHIPEKTRRSKVGLDLDREEAFEFGGGIDDADEEERERWRARLVGENDDDEEIDGGDDEEIDSDGAFEESDEERFAGFFSSQKKKTKPAKKQKAAVRFAEVDLNEDDDISVDDAPGKRDEGSDEDEEEEGDDDEFIDLLDVLDGKGEVDMGSDSETARKSKPEGISETRNGGEISSDQDEDLSEAEDGSEHESGSGSASDDEQMAFAPSDDEAVPEALDQLQDFVSKLDVTSKKRKPPEGDDSVREQADARARKRRLKEEKTEVGVENEFRAHASGAKLNLDDLLAPLASQSSALQSLKKSTKMLTGNVTKAKTLSAPLPQRTQERLDREAAYEQTKEEVDKWSDTMRRIREAEHLSFPLQAQPSGRVSNLELNAKFKPTTALESAVDTLLKSAKMREEDIHQTEDAMLEMNKLSVEEVAERRSELRKMRELMFRAEVKARRVGKIKSKTYRRLKKKEKERLGQKINEESVDDDEETRLKREIDRAKERATLRHKHTGKWARQMRNKDSLDEDSRKDIEEMLSRGEKLRRRIKGVGSDESEEDGDEDDEDDDEMDGDGTIEKIKRGAFDELQKLEEGDQPQESESRKGKNTFEMKFMKDAMARQAVAAKQSMDDFIRELGGDEGAGSDEENPAQEQQNASSGVITQRTGGRLMFRPGAPTTDASSSRPIASLASDTSSVTLKSTDLLSPPPPSSLQKKRSALSQSSAQGSNPWLSRDSEIAAKQVKRGNEVVVGKDSKAPDKTKHKLRKKSQKKKEERAKGQEDAVVEIDLDNALTIPSKPMPPSSKPAESTTARLVDDNDSDEDSEMEAQQRAMNMKGEGRVNGLNAFEQRELVALAFAGDNVVQNFEEAKRREMVIDAPREVDTTIPGWGSWGGSGTCKAPPKPSRIKKIAGIDPSTRADFNKKHVIISEKRDKKASKYLVKDLPYPYTSKAQFERAMEQPVGAEWNTRVAFQRATLPKVVKKPGVVINPLEKLG